MTTSTPCRHTSGRALVFDSICSVASNSCRQIPPLPPRVKPDDYLHSKPDDFPTVTILFNPFSTKQWHHVVVPGGRNCSSLNGEEINPQNYFPVGVKDNRERVSVTSDLVKPPPSSSSELVFFFCNIFTSTEMMTDVFIPDSGASGF